MQKQVLLFSLFIFFVVCAAGVSDQPGDPQLLTWNELVELYEKGQPPANLQNKLNELLTTPFVRNTASESGVQPLKPADPNIGKILRVVEWNIERGLEFDAIRFAFTDPQEFLLLMENKGSKAGEEERAAILEQIGLLQQADLLILNEVDWGVNRTLFRNVADELAHALKMNYAYGVEFVEVDPITMGIDEQVVVKEVKEAYAVPHEEREAMIAHVREVMTPDPSRYRGLHGNAILSRYALTNVRLIPIQTQGYDWYAAEKKRSVTGSGEGKIGAKLFKEQLVRQVRRGARTTLLADITDPEFPSGRVTVVATHLEDMTSPKIRRTQLQEILTRIQPIDHPVILAGDMNTSTHTGAPSGVTRALKQRFGSARWWAEGGEARTAFLLTPLGWAYDLSLGVIGFARKVDDPTRAGIPLLGGNSEAKFFDVLEDFRFDDGAMFDFRGDPQHSYQGRSGRFGNCNERSEKGFVPTEELGRRFGPIGRYKLDWIFVRPARNDAAFSCYNGRTLPELNHAIPDRISDHNPIIVDLPLNNVRH